MAPGFQTNAQLAADSWSYDHTDARCGECGTDLSRHDHDRDCALAQEVR